MSICRIYDSILFLMFETFADILETNLCKGS